jgi:hypothetical protein
MPKGCVSVPRGREQLEWVDGGGRVLSIVVQYAHKEGFVAWQVSRKANRLER